MLLYIYSFKHIQTVDRWWSLHIDQSNYIDSYKWLVEGADLQTTSRCGTDGPGIWAAKAISWWMCRPPIRSLGENVVMQCGYAQCGDSDCSTGTLVPAGGMLPSTTLLCKYNIYLYIRIYILYIYIIDKHTYYINYPPGFMLSMIVNATSNDHRDAGSSELRWLESLMVPPCSTLNRAVRAG